jgi:hypothetical protein
MNKNNFWFQVLSCFFAMMFLVVTGCSSSNDSTSSTSTATYTISGTITGANAVTVTLGGDSSNSTTVATSGETYSFTGLSAGNYTITPTLEGYSFTPAGASATISAANVTQNFTATAGSYAQTDLEGTWNYTALKVASTGAGTWEYSTANIDSTGNLTAFSNCNNSSNSTTCPAANAITWTLGANGVITEGGTDGNATAHMTMASDKAFIAGTSNTDSSKYQLIIAMQKAASYSSSSLYSKSFVFHQLRVGANGDGSQWSYGAGNIDSSGTLTITSKTKPSGTGSNTEAVSESTGIVSVDSSTGVVTISGDANFHGFLSYDGKTIVGVETDSGNAQMAIIQITGQTYTAGNVPDSTSYVHLLMGEANGSAVDGWMRWTETISGGTDTQSDYTDTFGGSGGGTVSTPAITSAGVVTTADSTTYNGQMSYDKSFIVGTVTASGSGSAVGYGLIVHTIKN